jgi:hypothetical protein
MKTWERLIAVRRDSAVRRGELLLPTSARSPTSGTSKFPIKEQDPYGLRQAIEEFKARNKKR